MYYQEDLSTVSVNPENDDHVQKKRKAIKNEPSNVIQCEVCGLVNFNAWSLTMHMRRHNNERPAKCSYCPASFVNNTELKSHLTTHTKEKNYRCRFCPRRFTNKSSKYLHEDTHGILEHKCKFCHLTFRSQLERRIHQKTHIKEDLSCRFCIKKFVNEKFLRIHEQTYHARSLRCLKCKLMFRTQEELQIHKSVHKSGRRVGIVSKKSNEVSYFQDADVKLSSYFFTCGICLQKFSFHRDLTRHIETFHHLEEKESIYRFKCVICHKSFDTKMKLRGHMIGHGPKKHKCPHCTYCSTRGKDLSKHITGKHSNCKSFKCSECGMQFRYYSTFVAHKLKYGEKKFKCDMCDKAFYVKSRLCAHKRVSHYSANSVCELCGKVFKNIRSFRGHLRYYHNRPIPFCICNKCGKTIYANEIIHHQAGCSSENYVQLNNVKGPPCSICHVTFSAQRDLLEHVKELHPSEVFSCKVCLREYLSHELLMKHFDKKHRSNKPTSGKERKHLLTSDEKKELKRIMDSGFIGTSYECFACGTLFGSEFDMNVHLDELVCLRCKSDNVQQKKCEEKQNFKVTKLYENNGCSQILSDFEVEVTPGYLNLDPLSISTSARRSKNVNFTADQKHPSDNQNPTLQIGPSCNVMFTEDTKIGNTFGSDNTILIDKSYVSNSSKTEDSSQKILPSNSSIQESGHNGVVSTQELLKLLESKAINVDGTPFISINELCSHLKCISGVEVSSK